MDFNATRITESLIVGGGLAGPAEVAWLAAQGVTALISAAAELDDQSLAQGSGLPALHIPWADNGQAKPEEDFWHAYVWAAQQEQQAALAGKVLGLYVHCAAGVNRGPLLATYILALRSGLPGDTAFAFIRGQREQVGAFNNPAYRQSCLDALALRRPFIPAGPLSSTGVPVEGASADGSDVGTPASDAPRVLTLGDSAKGKNK